jgi:hypothetical protein
MVEELADGWGTERVDGNGKRVWAVLRGADRGPDDDT